ncbi:MAG TPA: hypothetical protein DEH78_07120 [Solibacterales bacterium]|nr:hypothetical protein [Bryobacterales bacterium]
MREFEVRAEQKGLRFQYLPSANLGRITVGDGPRLRQILRQLLSNAVKFTPRGEVEVTAACRGARLEISVRDTGIGVSPEDLDRIFDSFRQLESGLARRYSGLGLGLALAQKLTVLLGGEMRANSRLGVGSCFQFWIPLRLADSGLELAPPPARPRQLPRRVLVVEDNRLAQTVIRHVLNKRKYEVECVASGEEALDVLRMEQVGLILMDLQMPGMTGIDAAVRVQQLPNGQGVPILALTANASDENRIRCREVGMKEFLSKPIQPEELLRAVGRHLP